MTAREALQEGELREAMEKLSNFVDADVLLKEELACLCRTLSDIHVEGAEATVNTHNARCQDASTYSGALENTHGEAESGGGANLGDEESLDLCGVSEDIKAEDQGPVERFNMLL